MAKKKRVSSNPIEEEMNELLPKVENPFDKVKLNFKYKNKKQKECAEVIKAKSISFVGKTVGTGKSFISLATALELIKDKNTPYEKLVCVVPPVQVDFDLGALPGDKNMKLDAFASPFIGNLEDLIGNSKKLKDLIDEGYIEMDCISFTRGKNYRNCIVIVDEAQQYPESSILTLLTRLCDSAKMIFCYDEKQCDNKYIKRGKENSGIKKAVECLQGIPQIGFVNFDKTHIVRNPIISTILSRWDPDLYGYLEDEDVGKNAYDLEDSNEENSDEKGPNPY